METIIGYGVDKPVGKVHSHYMVIPIYESTDKKKLHGLFLLSQYSAVEAKTLAWEKVKSLKGKS